MGTENCFSVNAFSNYLFWLIWWRNHLTRSDWDINYSEWYPGKADRFRRRVVCRQVKAKSAHSEWTIKTEALSEKSQLEQSYLPWPPKVSRVHYCTQLACLKCDSCLHVPPSFPRKAASTEQGKQTLSFISGRTWRSDAIWRRHNENVFPMNGK